MTKAFRMLACLVAFCALGYMSPVSGAATAAIDFGAEWLKIAIVKSGVPMEIALNYESQRKTATIVGLRDGQLTFSDPALAVSVSHPDRAFRYMLNLLGRKVTHPSVKKYQERFPFYNIIPDETRGTVVFKVGDDQYTVEELVGLVLKHAAENAVRFAEQPISQYIITVPPFFNQAQRKALLNAAKLGGLKVSQLLNTNTAVAINYGIFRRASFNETEQNILFYDMGAQSTTATIVGYKTMKEKEKSTKLTPGFEIKGVGFDADLGGLDWDFRARDFLLDGFQKSKKSKGDITQNKRGMAKLFKEAQRLKKVLSANTETVSQIEGLFEDLDFAIEARRSNFETISQDLFDRVAGPIQQALAAAEMTPKMIDQIIIVGGGPRVPKVQDILMKVMGVEDLGKSINGDEAAALGAAFLAAATTTGFKVQPFIVRDYALYPIEVIFDREVDNSTEIRTVHRTLYHRGNTLPQKKSLTFNKFRDSFKFQVQYEPMTFLSESQRSFVDEEKLIDVDVSGVAEAFNKHETAQTKGVKVHFSIDSSGVFSVERADVVFELEPAEPSTLDNIRDTISGIFNSFTGETAKPGCEGDDCVGTNDDNEGDEASGEPKSEQPKAESTESASDDASKSDAEKREANSDEKPAADDKSSEQNEDAKNTEQDKPQESTEGQQQQSEERTKDEQSNSEQQTDKAQEDSTGSSEKDSTKKTEKAEKSTAVPPPPPKPKSVRETLKISPTSYTSIDLDAQTYEAANVRLQALLALEADRIANEAAKNGLEAFIYGTKEKFDTKDFKAVSTAEEREKLSVELDAANEWLYDEGFDAPTAVLRQKLEGLNKTAEPIFYRHHEYVNRQTAISYLLQSLNYTNMFLVKVKNLTENETWYSEKEISELESLGNETFVWLKEKWELQNKTALTEEPVLTLTALKNKAQRLDRELMYLVKKPKPKPKPTPKAEKKEKKAKPSEENTEGAEGDKEPEAITPESTDEPTIDQEPIVEPEQGEGSEQPQSTFDDKPKEDVKKPKQAKADKSNAKKSSDKKSSDKKSSDSKGSKSKKSEETTKKGKEESTKAEPPKKKARKQAVVEEEPGEPLELDTQPHDDQDL